MKQLSPPGAGDLDALFEVNNQRLTWVDLQGENTVVTVETIGERLWNEWMMSQTSSRDFNTENIPETGATNDNPDKEPEETQLYTVITPTRLLTKKNIAVSIEKLNKEHGTNYQLEDRNPELNPEDLFNYQ